MEVQKEFITPFFWIGMIFLGLFLFLFYRKQQRNPFKDESFLPYVLVMVAVGVVLRLMLAYEMPGYQTDMGNFTGWAMHVFGNGMETFYNGDIFADYPPLYIYVLYVLGGMREAMQLAPMGPESNLLIKMPAILCDIACGLVIYYIARKKTNEKTAAMLSALVLVNPAVIFNSCLWGQMDVIITLLMILCIYYIIENKWILSAALFAFAFLLKPQAVLIAPIYLYVWVYALIKDKDRKKILLQILGSIGIFAAIFFLVPLPFGANQEALWLVNKFKAAVNLYPQVTLNAMNLYGLLGMNFMGAAEVNILGVPGNLWGYLMIGVVCAYALWLFLKNQSKGYLFCVAAFVITGVFFFGHGMHERYLYPVPILLLMAFIYLKDKRLILCAVLLFAISLLNQSMALYWHQEFLPTVPVQLASVAGLACFAYFAYVMTRMAIAPPVLRVCDTAKPEDAPKEKQSRFAVDLFGTEQTRLEGFSPMERLFRRKDMIVMLVITAIYAVVAFTNLGATKIPSSSYDLAAPVTVQFDNHEPITMMKYYSDFGEGEFELRESADGAGALNVVHEKKDLYKWMSQDYVVSGNEIEISALKGNFPILEMAFFDALGNQVIPSGVFSTNPDAEKLFDEQDLVPYQPTYMTDFYFDELYHVRTAYENIHLIRPYEITHPPLGKIIIASGIEMLGMNPFGWRFMGTLAGVMMLPVMYALAKMLFKKTKYAAFATILFAADFMHFAQTRIGTVDSYSILWIMLSFLFMLWFAKTNFHRQRLSKVLLPLFLSGLFFGIGAATKWLCIYAGAGLLAIFVISMILRHKEAIYARGQSDSQEMQQIASEYRGKKRKILLWCVLFFLVIPAAIYLLSYIPYTMVTQGDAYSFKDILGNQSYMLNYHSTLDPEYVHPFSSKFYTWPLNIRPVLFFSNQADGMIATLSTMGNPLIWWTGLIAVILVLIDALRGRHRSFGMLCVGIALLAQFVPWWFVTREVFIYHYFASVPFLILSLVYWLKGIEKDFKYGKIFGIVLVCACVAMFAFFYPVITGIPASADYVNGLRWLETWPFY